MGDTSNDRIEVAQNENQVRVGRVWTKPTFSLVSDLKKASANHKEGTDQNGPGNNKPS